MDFLKEALGEELFEQVSEKLQGNDKIKLANLASGEYVSKAKYDALEKKLEGAEKSTAERDKQLEALKAQAAGSEALQAEISKLQEKNALDAKNYAERLAMQEREYALRDALKNTHRAHDALSVIPHLRQDTIIFKDGAFTGLEEQIKALKESKAFLFEGDDVTPGTGGVPAANETNGTPSSWDSMMFTGVRAKPEK